MIVGRLVGWILVLAGIAVLARDVMGWIDTRIWAPLVVGQVWYDLDRGSLNLAQAVVQRYLTPYLWDPIITSLLFCWVFAVLIGLGLVVQRLFRPRRAQGF